MTKRIIACVAVLVLLLAACVPAAAENSEEDTQAHTTVSLKLRKEPDSSAKVIETYKKGTAVTILKWGETWCRVQVGKKTGYMMTEYLSIPEGAMPSAESESGAAFSSSAPGRSDFRPEPGQ